MKLRDPDLLRTRAFIGGKWVDAMSGATHQIVNPATREPIGAVPEMGAAVPTADLGPDHPVAGVGQLLDGSVGAGRLEEARCAEGDL